MYRKFFLIIVICITSMSSVVAQCIPDPAITQNVPGLYPDSATGIPHAYVGIPYSTVIHAFVPPDTTYLGQPVILDSIKVTGITGLPSGFTYSCTPASCALPANANSCLLIEGAAPVAGMIGTYPLVVNLMVYGKIFSVPQSRAETNDNYSIVIESSTGLWSLSNGSFAVKQNSPNPFSTRTNISLSSRVQGRVMLTVTDLLGNTVYTHDYAVQKGINQLQLEASNFEAGIYIYTISDGKHSVTRRFVVSGKNDF